VQALRSCDMNLGLDDNLAEMFAQLGIQPAAPPQSA
jgi:hypothetical protein